MRHATIVTSIVLTLMSGFVLSQLWALETPRSPSIQAVPDPKAEETAAAFYRGVNLYLEHGDDASIRRLLHPDFATHQPGSSWSGTSDDLLSHLDTVRQLAPGMQVEAESVSLGIDMVSVTLSVDNGQFGTFADIRIDSVELFGTLEFLRIERGMIIQRWSTAPISGQLKIYPSLSIDLPFSMNTMISRVQKLHLTPASEPISNPVRHLLLIVTEGDAFLNVASSKTTSAMIWQSSEDQIAEPIPVATDVAVALEPLEAVFLPANTDFRIWGANNRGATILALEFGPPIFETAGDHANTALSGTVWSGIKLKGVGNRVTLSFGHALLQPGSTLASEDVEGIELSWVAGGSIDVTGSDGEIRVRKSSGARTQLIDGRAQIEVGEASAAGLGSDITYQNRGDIPATAWFFAIVPASSPVSPNDAAATPAGPTPILTPAPGLNRTLS